MRWSPRVQLADLQALLAAIGRSPIVARLSVHLAPRFLPVRDWASVRRSPDVDAYVLAWIASHVRRAPDRRRMFM